MTSNLYYAEFRGDTFVIQAESDAVENTTTTLAVLRGIGDLLDHGIRVVLVFGKGVQFEHELCTTFGAVEHPETSRLVIPENALPRMLQKRRRIAEEIGSLCRSEEIPHQILPESVVRAERRLAHGSTGIVTEIDVQAIRSILNGGKLAVIGFGGEDERHQFLHVPSVSLAADLAVELQAQKLLLLAHAGGIFVPARKGGSQQLSFADLEQLLCLLQRKTPDGQFLLSGAIVPKIHASIRAVAGSVQQVHIVSYARVLDEILTRTGVGTMIERQQSHHVDYARDDDLDEIERLHAEAQRYTTPLGTPYVKPLDRAALERLLSHTLVLKHRGIIVGKLHTTAIDGQPGYLHMGGVVIGEDLQDSQHGQLLISEALGRFRERGLAAAVAVTASPRAKRLFERCGGVPVSAEPWQSELRDRAVQRYAPGERSEVEMLVFSL